jgi:hypothetical protein
VNLSLVCLTNWNLSPGHKNWNGSIIGHVALLHMRQCCTLLEHTNIGHNRFRFGLRHSVALAVTCPQTACLISGQLISRLRLSFGNDFVGYGSSLQHRAYLDSLNCWSLPGSFPLMPFAMACGVYFHLVVSAGP